MMNTVYQKMTDVEHVLNRPDTYIGSVNLHKVSHNLFENNEIKPKTININYGFFKIFDEIITNSIDESKKNKKLNKIDVTVDSEKISITDNGGIPVVQLAEYDNIYTPEFLFGEMRTSGNYDDTQKRDVAGTNGIGAKATCIFSKKFVVETADGKKSYKQEFLNNLSSKTKPLIKSSTKGFTKITYYPDVTRFKLKEINRTHIEVFKKRIVDLAGLYNDIKFTFNGERIIVKSFSDYCEFYGIDKEHFFYTENESWKVGVTYSDDGFQQTSFVNGNMTTSGGTHVEYIFRQIVDFLRPFILKKYKIDVKPYEIRNILNLFISSNITNNRYSSQTKEKLNTDEKDFGHYIELPKTFLNKISKSEIVNRIIDWKRTKIELAEKVQLRKLNNDVKKLKVPNLIDCSTKNRNDAELFIFEGFSASSGGIKHRDSKTQALYLLKGKILNTYGLKPNKILQNKEIAGLVSTLGLTLGNPDISNLRYGKILITTDMDVDGSNIASLIISFLASNWIDLFKEERVYRVITPLLILRDGKKQYDIYSEEEYSAFLKKNGNKKYRIEYKKGLGALSDTDYKKMMNSPKLLQITQDEEYSESLDNWFGKDSDKRKEILLNKN